MIAASGSQNSPPRCTVEWTDRKPKVVRSLPGQGFEVTIINGVTVVSAPSEIDISNADGLRSALLSAAGHLIVADLGRTEFCDSSGLNVLVRTLRRSRQEGREFRLVARMPAVLRLLRGTGVGSILSVYESVGAALAAPEDRQQERVAEDAAPTTRQITSR